MEKRDFLLFIGDILANSSEEKVDTSILEESINQVYQGTEISNKKYKAIIIATFNTVKESSSLLQEVDSESTLMAGEIKSIDSIWESQLQEHGFSEDEAEKIVDSYSSEFIQKLQLENE